MSARHAAAALLVCLSPGAFAQTNAQLDVGGVAANDVLNLHAEPDAAANISAILPPDTKAVDVIAQATASLDWLKLRKGTKEGWANARYLRFADGLPARLSCSGSEPFWSLAFSYSRAEIAFASTGRKRTLAMDAPRSAQNRTGPFLLESADKGAGRAFLVVDAKKCVEAPGKASPYSVLVRLEGAFLSGCCR